MIDFDEAVKVLKGINDCIESQSYHQAKFLINRFMDILDTLKYNIQMAERKQKGDEE